MFNRIPQRRFASTQRVANEIAQIIVAQLGGAGKLKAMTGARQFVALPNGVQIHIPRTGLGIGMIEITVTANDSYDLKFYAPFNSRTLTRKIKSFEYDVPVEKLRAIVEEHTGLYLSLGTGGRTATAMLGNDMEMELEEKAKGTEDVINLLGGRSHIQSVIGGHMIVTSQRNMGGIIFAIPNVYGNSVAHIMITVNEMGTYNIDFFQKTKSTTPKYKKRLINVPAEYVKQIITKYAKIVF